MQAPSFTKSMEPVTVSEGEAAIFNVEFDGQPNPAVTWYRYSFPVKDSKDFPRWDRKSYLEYFIGGRRTFIGFQL